MSSNKQHDFIVNDTTYSTFPFSVEGEDGLRIDVEITNINSDAHEYNYFIISEPDINELSIDGSNELIKLLMTSNFYWWRLLLSNSTKSINLSEYDESYIKMDSQMNYGIQLTKTHQEIIAMPSCTSMEDVELVLSNTNDYDMEYMLVAFLDWEQIPIDDDDMTKFIKIPSQTNIYLKMKIPYVEKDTPYQIFAIPKPYSNDLKNAIPPSSTLRTIILPK